VGVDLTGPNKLCTVIVHFELFEELVKGEWVNCLDQNLDITGYFYVEKRDGSLNTITIDALKAAFQWDGIDPFWLQDTDLSEMAAQLKLGFEEYEGKRRLKVQFLNPYGSSGGGVSQADNSTRQTIMTRLGAKLRARSGGTPANAPAPTAPKPAAPEATAPQEPAPPQAQPAEAPSEPPSAPAQPEPPAQKPTSTLEDAWTAFVAKFEEMEIEGQKVQEQHWFTVMKKLFGTQDADALTPEQWAVMKDRGPANISPF